MKLNVSPTQVLYLAKRILETQETYETLGGGKCAELGDLLVYTFRNCLFIAYRHGQAAVLTYNTDTDTIVLLKGADRYLQDIIQQFGEVLPLESLAAIEE